MNRWLLLTCAVLGLTACATSPESVRPSQQIRATHGLVLGMLPQGEQHGPVRLQSIQGGTTYALKRQSELDTGLYGQWLPAGDYQIVDLVQSDGNAYPPISVQPGRVTSLGAVLTVQLGGYEYMQLAFPHPEAQTTLQKATQKLQADLTTTENLSWSTSTLPKIRKVTTPNSGLGLIADLLSDYDRRVNQPPLKQRLRDAKTVEEVYQLALTALPPQTDEPGVDADGTLYYGAELGQVRVRSREGVWTNLDTGTLQAITSVEVNGKQLLAGTAHGEIRSSEDNGHTWRSVVHLNETESVVDIDRVGTRWIVITTQQALLPTSQTIWAISKSKLYRSASEEIGSLELLRETAPPDPVATLWGITARGQAVDGNTYYVNTFTELLKLDVTQKTWTVIKPPQASTTRFGPSADGKMLTAYLARGGFSKLHVSFDQGMSWRALDTPPYTVFDVHFDSLEKGRATRMSSGAFSVTFEYMSYNAAADRWVKDYEAPAGCVRLLRDADNFQRFCLTNGGSILDHATGQWSTEFAAE